MKMRVQFQICILKQYYGIYINIFNIFYVSRLIEFKFGGYVYYIFDYVPA